MKALKRKDLSLDARKRERNSTEKWGEIGNYRTTEVLVVPEVIMNSERMLEQTLPELKSEMF